jgi:hypothetical protein
MGSLGLFLRALLQSSFTWIGGILRIIPLFESLIEPYLRKFAGVKHYLDTHGAKLKKDLNAIVIACLFIGCYRVWVFEHRNAETAMYGPGGKAEAWSRFNGCEAERLTKSNLVDVYSAELTHERALLDNQQGTVSSCVTTLGKMLVPETARIKTRGFLLGSATNHANPDEKVIVLVAETTRRIPGLKSVTVKCQQEFQVYESQLTQGVLTLSYIPGYQLNKTEKEIQLQFSGANWDTGDLLLVFMNGVNLDQSQCAISQP